MKKTFNNIIEFIKEDYKFLIFCILILFIGLYKLPYNLYTGGGIININNKVIVENSNKVEGSMNMAYVKQVRATIPTYLLSYIFDWEREKVSDTLIDEHDTPDDLWDRERLYMEEANTNALISAFNLANEEIEIIKENVIIIYLVEEAKTNVKVGDIIINVDNKVISDVNDLTEIVSNYNLGDKINIKVLRNNKEIDCYAEVVKVGDSLKVGIALIKDYEYKTNRKVKFDFDNDEAGPSGGLMLALEIYNQLTSDDITKGEKIAGTGTIDINGKVGKIGGIKYKLKGAESGKAKVFFVPVSNYEEAIKEKENKKYKIEVVKVETINDAINYLKEMN